MDFNLFESANENQEMTISFTSGNCGACNFIIGATEDYPQKNPVQVDANGNLIYKDGRVWCGLEGIEGQSVYEYQPRQQDTSKYEVWVALKKEVQTYGTLMPSKSIRPQACSSATSNDGDTFVILGINLPESYIIKAEKKLESEIIKYMKDNNDEKFNFSITLSRIFFAENPSILQQLTENSSLYVIYNGVRYPLYVSSISYNMGEGDILPEVRVELVDSLSVSQNAIQAAVSQVKAEMNSTLANIDVVTAATPYFIRKDQDDEVQGTINFKKGVKFGEGGRVSILDDNSAKLSIEYLEVTKKATFTSLEIQEKTHVGGQFLLSPAAMTCGEVEELEDAYRCYFQTKGQDGSDEIFNQFVVGDQAICQTFNAWQSHYYWRLVIGVGEDYIDLSKTDCDENSDIPMAGDKIIQLGHRTDKARQAAQVLSSHGETSPSLIMYNGIDEYSLVDKNITGIIWNPATQEPQMYSYGSFFFGDRQLDGNYITFQPVSAGSEEKKLTIHADVVFGEGSQGLSNLSEWTDFQTTVESSIDGVKSSITQVQDQIDGVIENWNGLGTPTLSNEPAVSWTTDNDKIAHINDTYINIEEYVDDSSTPTAGQAWRWCDCGQMQEDSVEVTDKNGNTLYLHWHPIADSDAVRALKEAAEATRIASEASRVNLLSNSSELVIPAITGNYNFKPIAVPVRVKKDDTFTFAVETAQAIEGSFSEFSIQLYSLDVQTAYSAATTISLGNKVSSTIVVNSNSAQSIEAVLLIYAGKKGETAGKSLRLSNFSLVKGSTPMNVWEDCTLDSSFNNLLSVAQNQKVYDTSLVEGHNNQYTYFTSKLPSGVKKGERYTFFCLYSRQTAGTDTIYKLVIDDGGSNALCNYTELPFGVNNCWRTMVIHTDSNVARLVVTKTNQPNTTSRGEFKNISLVKGSSPLVNWRPNTDYLFNAFKNGTTKISGGLVMAQAVMVEDGSGNVKGMLNGSDYGKDTTHGKLILAAGSSGTTEANMREANTRIYENGKILSNSIELQEGCKIGDSISIRDSGIFIDTVAAGGRLFVSDGGIFASNLTSYVDEDLGTIVYEGRSVDIASCSTLGIRVAVGGSYGYVEYCPAKGNEIGLLISNRDGGDAIRCPQGVFSGLRPNIRTVSSNTTLDSLDHTIYVAAACTITLASMPPVGQCYKIVKSNSLANVKISAMRKIGVTSSTADYTIPTNATTVIITAVRGTTYVPMWHIDYIAH